jgi:peroxiredoxin Q/BCP
MLSPKDPAPAFSLPSTSGRAVSSKDLLGQRYVLYFYPKDDTPGCTREACDFRDNLARLGAAAVRVFGVSKDSIASHQKFQAKYGLTFELLSDEGNAVAKAYGAFGEKTMYGKPVTGVIRSTFLIGADGRVERVWSPVKVEGHVEAVLAAIAAGAAAPSATTLVPPRAAAAKQPAAAKTGAPKSAPAKGRAKASATRASAAQTGAARGGAAKSAPKSGAPKRRAAQSKSKPS